MFSKCLILTNLLILSLVPIDGSNYLKIANNDNCTVSTTTTRRPPVPWNQRPHQFSVRLFEAASKGDLDEIERVLKAVDPNAPRSAPIVNGQRDFDGETALMVATVKGHLGAIRLLIAHGAKVNTRNWQGYTALLTAIKFDQKPGVIRVLLDKGSTSVVRGYDGWSPLVLAARNKRQDLVRILLENGGCQVRAKDANGWTALIWASYHGMTESVRLLIEHGADVNQERTEVGDTAIIWAASKCQADTVRLLLDSGANAKAQTFFGRSALSWAATNGCRQVVDLLRFHS